MLILLLLIALSAPSVAGAGQSGGLIGYFYPNSYLGGAPTCVLPQPTIGFNRSHDCLGPNVVEFSVRWVGSLRAPRAGNLTLHLSFDDAYRVWIGDRIVVDAWSPVFYGTGGSGGRPYGPSRYNVGIVNPDHPIDLQIDYANRAGPAWGAQLSYSIDGSPVSVVPPDNLAPRFGDEGLFGEYFDSPTMLGYPSCTGIDQQIDLHSQAACVGGGNWSARWTGFITAPRSGKVEFQVTLRTDTGVAPVATLWIANAPLVEPKHFLTASRHVHKSMDMEVGAVYPVRFEVMFGTPDFDLTLNWFDPVSNAYQPVPRSVLTAAPRFFTKPFPQPDPNAVADCKCGFSPGFDMGVRGQIGHIAHTTAKCCELCQNSLNCTGWTWNSATRVCMLNPVVPPHPWLANADVISAVMPPAEEVPPNVLPPDDPYDSETSSLSDPITTVVVSKTSGTTGTTGTSGNRQATSGTTGKPLGPSPEVPPPQPATSDAVAVPATSGTSGTTGGRLRTTGGTTNSVSKDQNKDQDGSTQIAVAPPDAATNVWMPVAVAMIGVMVALIVVTMVVVYRYKGRHRRRHLARPLRDLEGPDLEAPGPRGFDPGRSLLSTSGDFATPPDSLGEIGICVVPGPGEPEHPSLGYINGPRELARMALDANVRDPCGLPFPSPPLKPPPVSVLPVVVADVGVRVSASAPANSADDFAVTSASYATNASDLAGAGVLDAKVCVPQAPATPLSVRTQRTVEELLRDSPRLMIAASDLDFHNKREIGRGAFGVVYRTKLRGLTPVVVKQIQARHPNETEEEYGRRVLDFKAEMRNFVELPPHPNIIQLLGLSVDAHDSLSIVLEYMPLGCLRVNIDKRKRRGEPATEGGAYTVLRDIALGMAHLAHLNVVHCDLAARNVLLAETRSVDRWQAKITDFGLARLPGAQDRTLMPIRWSSPEVLSSKTFSEASDVWSYGVVTYEVLTQEKPYATVPQDSDVKDQVLFGDLCLSRPSQPAQPDLAWQAPLFDLMDRCLSRDPASRPTFLEIIHNFLPDRDQSDTPSTPSGRSFEIERQSFVVRNPAAEPAAEPAAQGPYMDSHEGVSVNSDYVNSMKPEDSTDAESDEESKSELENSCE
eukprot:TRINITY_DN3958_c0_g1_i1.p1 TRINITY_DN3958_c0_g1~~TRINITY_DN3958_c0_g1_i1.p1  ORF type:complete len:1108 (+),score=286.59 TRINITY_DN3958_c0_g1_i1:179-3502(+)